MTEPIDENDNEQVDELTLGDNPFDWMLDLVKRQNELVGDKLQTMEALNDLLSPVNIELLDELVGAMLIYTDDFPSLISSRDGLSEQERDFIYREEVCVKAKEIVEGISDDKLRGILIGMSLLLQNEGEGKNIVLVATDIYYLVKHILNDREGLI